MSIIVLVAFLFLPISYVHIEWFRRLLNVILGWMGQGTDGVVQLSDMTSLIEVSVGLNLALSILTSFSNAIRTYFTKITKEYDPELNATFLEAMKEAAESNGKELGASLDHEVLQKKYIGEVKRQIADFEADISNSEERMKALGIFAALSSFVLLGTTAVYPDFRYPMALFYITAVGAVLPILVHVVTLSLQLSNYNTEVKANDLTMSSTSSYKAYIRDVHKIYSQKKKLLDRKISVPGQKQ